MGSLNGSRLESPCLGFDGDATRDGGTDGFEKSGDRAHVIDARVRLGDEQLGGGDDDDLDASGGQSLASQSGQFDVVLFEDRHEAAFGLHSRSNLTRRMRCRHGFHRSRHQDAVGRERMGGEKADEWGRSCLSGKRRAKVEGFLST